jgi:septin family protein
MVIGAKNSGKTSFISFLKHSLALPADKPAHGIIQPPETAGVRSSFTSSYLETEIEGERIGLTLWDSAGLEKNIADLQLREMTAFIESKFEETFAEEQKVSRTPGSKDTHIHCVFLLLDPVDLDSSTKLAGAPRVKPSQIVHPYEDENLQAMRALWGKTTVIPVISKADTVTIGHMSVLKRGAWDAIKSAKLDPLEALELEDDGDDDDADDGDEGSPDEDTVDSLVESDSSLPQPKSRKNHHRQSSLSLMQAVTGDDLPYLPMSIISPDPFDMPPFVAESKFPGKIGRRFPWGFADSHNPEHCDFNRLRDSVFSEWRVELRELSRTRWYESWRTARLKNVPGSSQRIRGGVTPVTAVPKEGRIASQPARKSSLPALNRPTVPRSASTTANPPVNGHIVGLAIDSPDSSGPSETAPPTRRPSAAGPIRSSESQR